MDPTRPEARPPGLAARLAGSPWSWLLLVTALFSLPLIKGTDRALPSVPPGADSPPLDFTLPDESGREVSLSQLAGYLVIVTELPLANGASTEAAFGGLRALRKRLRGLGSAVVYAVLCHGGSPADLSALLDAKHARKPVNVFLLDEDGATIDWLRREAGSLSAAFFLLDSHARLRGVYAGNQQGVDQLVASAGLLANWAGADPGR